MSEETEMQAVDTEVNEPSTEVDVTESVDEESSPSETDQEDQSEEAADADKPKKKGGFQRRIDELTRARYEAEQRARQLETELQQARQAQVQGEHESTKPRIENYDDPDQWASDYQRWVEQGIERQQQEQQQAWEQQQLQHRAMEQQRKVSEKIAQAMQKYPDFMEKITDPSLPQIVNINPAAYEAIVESDHAGEVAYYLANNPAEIYKFQGLTPVQAAREVVRLENKLAGPQKPVTKAPPPPSSINGRSPSEKDPDQMTMEEFVAWREAQTRPRG